MRLNTEGVDNLGDTSPVDLAAQGRAEQLRSAEGHDRTFQVCTLETGKGVVGSQHRALFPSFLSEDHL